MKKVNSVAVIAAIAVGGVASADIAQYSQDFEGLDMGAANALENDGWLVGANVFEPDGTTFVYNYFSFPAPNGGVGFSAIVSGQGGVDQGAQQLSVYNDYNNADHNIGRRIEANVFQEWTVGAADVGTTQTFSFDAKLGNLELDSTAVAFIKVLDPGNGFASSGGATIDMTNTPVSWTSYSMSVDIDASQVGHIFQIGFWSVASNFEGSGVFYDNINLVPAPSAMALLGLGGLVAGRRRR
jgi:hypothetical protein